MDKSTFWAFYFAVLLGSSFVTVAASYVIIFAIGLVNYIKDYVLNRQRK